MRSFSSLCFVVAVAAVTVVSAVHVDDIPVSISPSSSLDLDAIAASYKVASTVPGVTLKNAAKDGVVMPAIGLGVGAYGTKPTAAHPNGTNGEYWTNATCAIYVREWLLAGGRRIDTSLKWYHDLAGVRVGIQASGIPREEIFVTSKVDIPMGYNETLDHFKLLVEVLGSQPDLTLIHWPGPTYFLHHHGNLSICHTEGRWCRQETWKALELLFQQNQTRAIGVANFEKNHLQDILDLDSLIPAVNQFEYHPYWHENDLKEYCWGLNITTNSYAPLGAPDFMAWQPTKWPVLIPDQPVVKQIAAEVGRSPCQVLLQWNLQQGFIINPRTNKIPHMMENLAIMGNGPAAFNLTAAQMEMIDNITPPAQNKVCPDPHLVP